jgi:hypothetical protein
MYIILVFVFLCGGTGHTRVVKIPDCVPFQVTTNACRGFCLSYAIPSPTHTLAYNPSYIITSRAECCGIVDTQDVRQLHACSLMLFKLAYLAKLYAVEIA